MTPNSPTLEGKKIMDGMHKIAMDVMFTHMTAKKVIKRHGEKEL